MPGSSISVVHAVLSLDVGGLERIVLDLATQSRSLGQSVSILCVEKPGVLAGEARSMGTMLYSAEKGPGLRPSVTRQISSILSEIKPDVVHAHQATALLYVAGRGRRNIPALIYTEHNNQFLRYHTLRQRFPYTVMLAIAAHRADRVVGVSNDAVDALLHSPVVPRRKVIAVPNGINLTRFVPGKDREAVRHNLGIGSSTVVFGTIGRMNEMKRQDILISAFATISPELSDTRLVLVGDGPALNDLRQQADALGVRDRVIFAGYQPDPQRYLAAFDVFAQTSRIEGMPLAVLEAEAMSLPVIASRVGGLEEMSNHGKSILLYDFGDNEALLNGLRKLATDADFRRQFGGEGREHVLAAYSVETMARAYDHMYREVLHDAN